MAKTSYQSRVHWRMDGRLVLVGKSKVSPYLKIPCSRQSFLPSSQFSVIVLPLGAFLKVDSAQCLDSSWHTNL
jgi:hypothetical protein